VAARRRRRPDGERSAATPAGWPPTDEEHAAAKMRDATFVLVLRTWLLQKRVERLGDAELAPSRRKGGR